MAKRTFAGPGVFGWVIAVAVLLFAATVHAQLTPVAVDGCAKLARVIHSEVAAAATYGPGKSGPWLIDPGKGDISICTHTARTVSRAFTAAMKSAGVAVKWHVNDAWANPLPSDYCLNAFLAQCFPARGPVDVVDRSDRDFVQRSWALVAKAVMREMYNPVSSDEVRFRDNDLKLRIGLSLRSIDATSPRRLPSRR
jgi:hypothetical protein